MSMLSLLWMTCWCFLNFITEKEWVKLLWNLRSQKREKEGEISGEQIKIEKTFGSPFIATDHCWMSAVAPAKNNLKKNEEDREPYPLHLFSMRAFFPGAKDFFSFLSWLLCGSHLVQVWVDLRAYVVFIYKNTCENVTPLQTWIFPSCC